jgi:hypothetical protein
MLSLFVFSGLKLREKWDVANLDDISRPLSPSELRTVSLVDHSQERAQRRAESAGWMRLNLIELRTLSDEKLALAAFNQLLDDRRFGVLWAYFADVLEGATFDRNPQSDLEVSFITKESNYSVTSTPKLAIHTQDDGDGTLLIGGPALKDKTESLTDELDRHWSVPMELRQTRISRKLEQPWSMTDAIRLGLETLVLLFPISSRDFMKISGSSIMKKPDLDRLRIAIHGSEKFFHLRVPEGADWAEDLAELLATPLPTPKLNRRLSSAKRENFVSQWKHRFPDVHDWSDGQISFCMFHGM